MSDLLDSAPAYELNIEQTVAFIKPFLGCKDMILRTPCMMESHCEFANDFT